MKKIMVVENSPTIISVADSLLRQRGYDVTCLSDGQKALELARAERPDLILTALGLDGLNGIDLSKQVSSDPIIGGIPIILLIGEKDAGYLEQADLSGARGRIKKPFSPKELLSVVEKYLSSGETSMGIKIVDQSAKGAPKLKSKVSPQEIGTATNTTLAKNKTKPVTKHETVFNLEWEDLNDSKADGAETPEESDLDDSGLVLEEDQYGLTERAEKAGPSGKGNQDEDYDWFIGEMKKDIEEKDEKPAETPKPPPKSKPRVAYNDIGSSTKSKDESKYREFLDQFKQDAKVLTHDTLSADNSIDVNWLVDRIADKLAQKIVEKLDKQELKQIIGSFLNVNK
ncbi:MAG: response regulator [candidate division Zixibacteria bacterium]|nr:response regulator [candidate division Zixibacteria bacterium]